MTDIGLRIESQRSSSFVLRSYLEQGRWQRYILPDQRQLVSCQLTWPKSIDPFSLLDAPGQGWRFLWRSRDSLTIKVGLGQALVATACHQTLVQSTGKEAWFVAMPFPDLSRDPDSEPTPIWGTLGAGFTVLPLIEWSIAGGAIELTVRTVQEQDVDSEELTLKLCSVLRDYLPLTLTKSNEDLQVPRQQRDEPSFPIWQTMINEAVAQIRQQNLAKVVLSRSKILEFDRPIEMAPILRRLSELTETSYLFAVRSPDGLGFVGRSPERLLAWNPTSYYVDAIAGTRRRDASRRIDFNEATHLRSSAKDLSEHRFVSNYVATILGRYSTHLERVEQESLLRLQNVQHIRSRFRGVRDLSQSPFSLLMELHPTPAVGGLPKDAASAFIANWESISRGLFAGAFGCIQGLEEGDLAIGIRSALVHQKQLHLFAGAGIVEESDPEWEWQETEVKMKNFTDLFLDLRAR